MLYCCCFQDLEPRLRDEYLVLVSRLRAVGLDGILTAPPFAGKFGVPDAVPTAAKKRVTLYLGLRWIARQYGAVIVSDMALFTLLLAALTHLNVWSLVLVILLGTLAV
jgi:hypothetical protein